MIFLSALAEMRSLLDTMDEPEDINSVEWKLRTFYWSCMNVRSYMKNSLQLVKRIIINELREYLALNALPIDLRQGGKYFKQVCREKVINIKTGSYIFHGYLTIRKGFTLLRKDHEFYRKFADRFLFDHLHKLLFQGTSSSNTIYVHAIRRQ